MATTPRDLGRIKHALLARRTSLRQRHERIKLSSQQKDAALHLIDDATSDELITVDEALQSLDQGYVRRLQGMRG